MATYSRPSGPLSIGGVLDDGLRLYRASVGPLYVLALIAALISNSQSVAMVLMMGPGQPPTPQMMLGAVPIVIVASLATTFLYAAIIARLGDIAAQKQSTIGHALGVGVRRGLPLIVGGFLFTLATVVGLILLLVPGLYLMVTLSFLGFPIVLEGRGPIAGLSQSHAAVKGSWWRTATLLTVAFVIALIPYVLVSFVAGVLTTALMTPETILRWTIVNAVLISVFYAFVLPMLICIQYSIYRDLQLRRGGADLEQRLEAVNA